MEYDAVCGGYPVSEKRTKWVSFCESLAAIASAPNQEHIGFISGCLPVAGRYFRTGVRERSGVYIRRGLLQLPGFDVQRPGELLDAGWPDWQALFAAANRRFRDVGLFGQILLGQREAAAIVVQTGH